MESSICVPNVLGSNATETPVPNNPLELTPTHPDKINPKDIINKEAVTNKKPNLK